MLNYLLQQEDFSTSSLVNEMYKLFYKESLHESK